MISSQVLTLLYSPDKGSSALPLGNIYAVEGHVDLLDDNQTWALWFDANRAHLSPPPPLDDDQNQILIDSVGTILAITFVSNVNDNSQVQLVLKVEHQIQVRVYDLASCDL
jgi:hypothetical protein